MEQSLTFLLDLQMPLVRQLNTLGEQSNRMQKLQEEQGELAGAIRDYANMHHIAEEAIDVLLMLVSIHADHSSSDELDVHPMEMTGDKYTKLGMAEPYLCLCECIGAIAECNQIIGRVSSSAYKAPTDTIDNVYDYRLSMMELGMQMCTTIMRMAHCHVPSIDLQGIYNLKLEKWERVAK